MDVAQLLEEEHGIVDPVKPELQRRDIAAIQMDSGFFAGKESAVGADREIWFGGLGQRGKQQETCKNEASDLRQPEERVRSSLVRTPCCRMG